MNFQNVENPGLVLEANVATRASLLRRVCDWNDDASWQEFFDLYWRILYSVAIQSGLTESEAEEAVQATMISVAKKIRDFHYDPKVGSFRRWICNQAQWKATDFLRRRAREQNHLQQPRVKKSATHTGTATIDRIPDDRDVIRDVLENDWARAIVHVALAEVKTVVPPKQFQMFDLHVVKKWPIRDVAKLLQVSIPQVYLAKSRVSRLLRQRTKKVEARLERLPSPLGKNKKRL